MSAYCKIISFRLKVEKAFYIDLNSKQLVTLFSMMKVGNRPALRSILGQEITTIYRKTMDDY